MSDRQEHEDAVNELDTQIKALQEENQRLREALEIVAAQTTCCEKCIRVAQKALTPAPVRQDQGAVPPLTTEA